MRTGRRFHGTRARLAVLAVATAAAAILPATAAVAKGDMQPLSARLAIAGPGLAVPISAGWKGSCFMFAQFACSNKPGVHREQQGFPSDLGQVGGAMWDLGNESNFLAQMGGRGGSFLPPSTGPLGPKYHVTWVVSTAGTTESIQQDLYPYGPPLLKGLSGVPWLYTPKGQTMLGQPVGSGWMPALPPYFQDLVARGLPSVAPRVAPPEPANPAGRAPAPVRVPATSTAHGIAVWPIGVGVGLLLALVMLGVLAGRPRRRLQAA